MLGNSPDDIGEGDDKPPELANQVDKDVEAGQQTPSIASFGISKRKANMSSRRRLIAQQPTVSETADNETLYVRPVMRSERNVITSNRSHDSSEIKPTNRLSEDAPEGDQPKRTEPSVDVVATTCFGLVSLKPGTARYQAYLSYLTLGVIYGDIGTSPLYTISSLFTSPPTDPDSVIGGVSLLLWTLIIIVMFKYVTFILIADDYGEGGTFALFAFLNRGLRAYIKDDKTFRRVSMFFSVIAIIGVSAILADGILTPAISVLGAIAGLSVASSAVDETITVAVTAVILFLFFLPQRFGTSRVSFIFSPIVLTWYVSGAVIGIINITQYPRILLAFNPAYACWFLGGNYDGFGGWQSLGAAFLCVTGSEALYADMGHFNANAIRTSALLVVLPCLFLWYLGQGAYLAQHPEAYTNAMFMTLPDGALYPMLILGIGASIVASQAMVSATFSIVSQAIRLQYMPRLTVIHTDKLEFGQVYVPEINYFLMVMVIIVVAGYQNATALGYAYGVTVSLAFFITSFMYAFAIVVCYKRNVILGILFFCIFGLVDANFLAANLTKFVTGGWFSVMICLVISTILMVWRIGRFAMVDEQKKLNHPMSDLYKDREEVDVTGTVKRIVPTVDVSTPLLICFSSTVDVVPAAFFHFTQRIPVRPKNVVFVTVQAVNVAFVHTELKVEKVEGQARVYRMTVSHGYSERPPSARKLAAFLIKELDCAPDMMDYFPPPSDSELVRFVDPTFVIGRDRVVTKPKSGMLHTFAVDIFQVLSVFSRPASALLDVPPESTLEVGLQVAI